MNSNITIVTGLWDLGRGDLEGWAKRDFSHYKDRFFEILESDAQMCVWIPSDIEQDVRRIRRKKPTKIFIKNNQEFEKWNPFFEKIDEIRTNPEWRNFAGWLPESPQAALKYYNPMMFTKMFMLNDSAVLNPFNSKYFFWIDGGLTNTVNQGYFQSDKVLDNLERYILKNEGFIYLSYPYESNDEIHGFERNAMARYCNTDFVKYVCRGGFFGGLKETVHQINGIYYGLMQSTLSEGLMGADECLFTIIAHSHPQMINRFELHQDGLVWPFFEQLKDYVDVTIKPLNKSETSCLKSLIVHNPINDFMRNFREYANFWDDLTNALKEKYEVVENRSFESAHIGDSQIHLKKGIKESLSVKDCEYVIEDAETGDFYILSLSDQISAAILSEQDNPHLKKVLYSQYVPDQIVAHTKSNCHKYHPWIYFPQNNCDFESIYEKRTKILKFKDKMFFKGSRDYRPIISYIDPEILSDNTGLFFNQYLEDLITYKLALSIGGAANGDICYRDVEYMAVGIPMIRFEYVASLDPGLIPNYHYFSIPLPSDLPMLNDVKKDRLGNSEHAKLIEKRFKEIVNNIDYLDFVSENSRRYYLENLSPNKRVKKTLDLLGL